MEMRFHGNQVSWGINHSFINSYSKYQPSSFICSSIVLAPVISSLDEIYCKCCITSSWQGHLNSAQPSSCHARVVQTPSSRGLCSAQLETPITLLTKYDRSWSVRQLLCLIIHQPFYIHHQCTDSFHQQTIHSTSKPSIPPANHPFPRKPSIPTQTWKGSFIH